jgi:hypothetical protein
MGHQLLDYHKKNGIDQCSIKGIQKKLCNALAQVLGHPTRHNKALHEIVSVPQEQH